MVTFKNCESFMPLLLMTVCTVATIITFSKCLITYQKDEDNSQVEYKRFHSNNQSIYPSLSLCFKRPFLKEKLEGYSDENGSPVKVEDFSRFIYGKYWNDKFVDIDYDNVTIDLWDHLKNITIQLANTFQKIQWTVQAQNELIQIPSQTIQNYEQIDLDEIFPTDSVSPPSIYISNRGSEEYRSKGKCWNFDIPMIVNKPIHTFDVLINGSIFPDGVQPSKMEFSTWLSYPHQFLRSLSSQTLWESKIDRSEYYVKNIEVGFLQILKRRDKPSKRCISGWHDETIWNLTISKIGCIPAFWPIGIDLPKCSSQEQYDEIVDTIYDWTKHNNPCIAIEKIYDSFDEDDSSGLVEKDPSLKGLFRLKFYFPDRRFVEVIYIKEYNMESFIGNAGGYLGLFLGSGILQLASSLFDCLKGGFRKFVNDRNHI